MMRELARTISTCAIWLATATIFTFGLFRMNGSTEFFVLTTLIIAGAAAGATVAVWYTRAPTELPPGQAPTTDDAQQRSKFPGPLHEEQGITRKPGL
jgi:hypothetical protein